jgi:hypothetical protein
MTAAVANDNSPAARWNRGCLAEWRAGLSEERRAADQKRLSEIFQLAAKVPQLKEALDWANSHGIEFIVDRQTRVSGYYIRGTGVVAISAGALKDPGWAVGTVVHETRHAWQDWHGMLLRKIGRFSDYFFSNVLTEADADAYGERARRQYALRQKQEKLVKNLLGVRPARWFAARYDKQIEASQRDTGILWGAFKEWFSRGSAASYGLRAMKFLAEEFGIPGYKSDDSNAEFKPFGDKGAPRVGPEIDFMNREKLRQLGRGFSGNRNYFNGAAKRSYLESVFRPAMAERFYSRERKRPKLMDEIRKRSMLQRLDQAKAARPRLPA